MPLSTFTILSQPLHGFFVLNTNLSIVDTQVALKVFNTPNIHGNHLTVFKAFRVFLSEDAHIIKLTVSLVALDTLWWNSK